MFILKMVYCMYSLELPHQGDSNENTQHISMLKIIEKISLLCILTWRYDLIISSNYPCLKHIFMVPKVFESLKSCYIRLLDRCLSFQKYRKYVNQSYSAIKLSFLFQNNLKDQDPS